MHAQVLCARLRLRGWSCRGVRLRRHGGPSLRDRVRLRRRGGLNLRNRVRLRGRGRPSLRYRVGLRERAGFGVHLDVRPCLSLCVRPGRRRRGR